jgi:hypothetical protein
MKFKMMMLGLSVGMLLSACSNGGEKKKDPMPAEKPAPTCKVQGDWAMEEEGRVMMINFAPSNGTLGKGTFTVGERKDDTVISGSASSVDAIEDKKEAMVNVTAGSLNYENCAAKFNDDCSALHINCKTATKPFVLMAK